MRLAVRIEFLESSVRYCEHYANEIKRLLGMILEFSLLLKIGMYYRHSQIVIDSSV